MFVQGVLLYTKTHQKVVKKQYYRYVKHYDVDGDCIV